MEYLHLSEIPKRLPPSPRGKRVHIATVHRWSSSGIKADDGSRVKLSTWRVGGRRMTTQAALDQFITRLSRRDAPDAAMSARASQSHDDAERFLDSELGLGGSEPA